MLLLCETEAYLVQAQAIAARLGASVQSRWDWRAPEQPSFLLTYGPAGLALQQTGKKAPGPIAVDFESGAVAHRRKFGGGKGQLIAKAVGVKAGLRVLDATAGLGRDAFVLATLGCQVTLLERTPLVYELLADGLARAGASDDPELCSIVTRMALVAADSRNHLETLSEDQAPDVVYLDPMFPSRDKSALVKKEMAAFHSVVGADADADDLLSPALAVARYRVVVKRPLKAPCLQDRAPSHQVSGKTSRYDIYVNRKIP